ncbi:unnamed protein product [Dovyalis caffra]|uniref:Uncharacterized protein n=1 Tax=Dovyalis caffra TaxID=77055 RepID=A0AAV1RWJ1_9ROSI|nr:unnamed protein product [Dovyalis caffra]
MMKNGRILLEELIASWDGKCNPIRTFSTKELQRATNNYDSRQWRKYVYHEPGDVFHFLPDRVKDLIDNDQRLIEIVHPAISREDIEQQELQAVAKLALSCISEEEEDRPTMTDIARELKRIQKHVPPL